MRKWLFFLLLFLGLSPSLLGQSITMRDTLWLRKATHVNYDVAAWDTVFADIKRGSVLVQRVGLTSNGKGRWGGFWKPTYTGDFVAEYNAVYSGDTLIEEQYFAVLDTSAFMGTAAGLTAEEIMDSIEARGWFAGAGGFACTVYTKLAVALTPIADVRIIAKNTTETVTLGHVRSNANGWAILNLDSLAGGAYHHFWLTKPGYDFAFPESADVNGNMSVTFYGSVFDPGTPPSADLCRVWGRAWDLHGNPLVGQKVEAKIETSPLRYGNVVISPYTVSTIVDANGNWTMDLFPNTLLNPATTKYIFYIPRTPTGTILKVTDITVPDQDNWELQW